MSDLLPVDPAVATHPLVIAAGRLARDLLAPQAATVDAGQVPRSHLDALGAAGLLGVAAPRRVGGADADPAVVRRGVELLAGADLATWFVQAQHHAPVRALAASGAHDELLAQLATGRTVAGIAFSHLRQWPRRPLEAVRDHLGWRLTGLAPWYSGWCLNDVALVAGASAAGQVVFGLVPARPGAGVSASAPMQVAALRAAVTVSLHLQDCLLPESAVVSVQPIHDWLSRDALSTANPNPAVFGLAESALVLLAERGHARGERAAVEAAARLSDRVAAVRAEAYELIDASPPGARTGDLLTLRARSHQLLVESTTALVVAGAGGSMAADAPAQRKAREALFLLVQAQTLASRTANLEVLGR